MGIDQKYRGRVNLFRFVKFLFFKNVELVKTGENVFTSVATGYSSMLCEAPKNISNCLKVASPNLLYALMSFFVGYYGMSSTIDKVTGYAVVLGFLIFPLLKFLNRKFFKNYKLVETFLYVTLFGTASYLYFYFSEVYIAFSMLSALFLMFYIGNTSEILNSEKIHIYEDSKKEHLFLLYKLDSELNNEDIQGDRE